MRFIASLISLLIISNVIFAQEIPFETTPDWESAAQGRISTGLGLADINQDGYKDIIVADGNDINIQHLVVYYNNGDGTFPVSPDWESDDIDYHGHLAMGDFNNDLLIDVAVSVYIGHSGFSSPGKLKVYYNTGTELENTPSFVSQEFYNFSCATGDADGDGDIDIAVACGEPYGGILDYGRIYYNQNGVFSDDNIWESSIEMGSLDVDFGDFDLNGYLDVVFTCEGTDNYIYMADSTGQISTISGWNSTDPGNYINSVDVGYHFADTSTIDYSYIVMTGNSQLGGDGRVKMYKFDESPAPTTPYWQSYPFGYGSGITLYDVNQNDTTDLLYGGWWKPLKIALGTPDGFELNTSYTSSTNSVVETIHIADLGKESIIADYYVKIISDTTNLIILPRQNIERVDAVLYGCIGTPFQHIPGKNWVVFQEQLHPGEELIVFYDYSPHGDIVISNWDGSKGNYIFYNTNEPVGIPEQSGDDGSGQGVTLTPNPANDQVNIQINDIRNTTIKIRIIDIKGKEIKLVERYITGRTEININTTEFEPGIYFIRIVSENIIETQKLIVYH